MDQLQVEHSAAATQKRPNLRRRADEELSYWRKRAGWYDDDQSMRAFNNGVYDTYYQIDDDQVAKKTGTTSKNGAKGAQHPGLSMFLKVASVAVAIAILLLICRAISRRGPSKKSAKDGKSSKSRSDSKSRSGRSSSRSRSGNSVSGRSQSGRSRSRSRKSSGASHYELMDDKTETQSRRSTRSRSRSRRSRSRSSRTRSKSKGRAAPEPQQTKEVVLV